MIPLIQSVAQFSDATILVVSAASMVALALLMAFCTHRLWFSRRFEAIEEHNKLADVVHGSLLAFTVFILALVLADVRANLGRADDAVSREGSLVARLGRDLGSLSGVEASQARQSLRGYVHAVASDEWPMLSRDDPTLAPSAALALTRLVADTRQVGAIHPEAAANLRSLLDRLEEFRQGRLETATKSVPDIFWWLIAVFLLGAMALNGRHRLNGTALALIAIHMAAIGMVLALIIIMDEPFRGQTSISPAPLAKALEEAAPAAPR